MLRHSFASASKPVLLAFALLACSGYILSREYPLLLGAWVLVWLIPLAWHDLKTREVPSILMVAIPCALAAVWAWEQGALTLAGIAATVVIISERPRLPNKWLQRLVLLVGLTGVAVLGLHTEIELWPGALMIVGFWVVYEWGWWAGADAIVAIALGLLWPDVRLLLAMAVAHSVVLSVMPRRSLSLWPRVNAGNTDLETHGVPGLPPLALSAALYVAWLWFA